MKDVDEGNATKLLNGVHHMWDNCVVVCDNDSNQKEGIDQYDDEFDGLPGNSEQIIMSDVIVHEEQDIDMDNHSELRTGKMHDYALTDVWKEGLNQLIEMNPKLIRMKAEERITRKHFVQKYIIDCVRMMKAESMSLTIVKEKQDVLVSPWILFMNNDLMNCD